MDSHDNTKHQITPNKKLRVLPLQFIEVNDGVILKRGRVEIIIEGARALESVKTVLLAAMADGGATEEEISSCFAGPDRTAVKYLIDQLKVRNILIQIDDLELGSPFTETNLDVFHWHFGTRADAVAENLNSKRFVILGVNNISTRLVESLTASGVEHFEIVDYPLLRNLSMFAENGALKTAPWIRTKFPRDYDQWSTEVDSEVFDCLIATSDFGGQQMMREWNELCVKYGRHFLPIVLQDLVGYIGPLVVPGETACYECLRSRQNSHLEDALTQRSAEHFAFEGQAVAGFHPVMASVLADIAVMELTKFYGRSGGLWNVGALIEVNLIAPRLESHKVLKVPRCSVCSPLNRQSAIDLTKSYLPTGVPARAEA